MRVADLGREQFKRALNWQQNFVAAKIADPSLGNGMIVFESEHIYTQGRTIPRQKPAQEFAEKAKKVKWIECNRGGKVTYHGPGQLVIYLMIDIARLGIGARELVSTIEYAIVHTLSLYDLTAVARQDAPGVYIDDAKIASLGLRIRKGKSFHGLSLNVDMDLEPFKRINPCGYKGLEMIQLTDFHSGEVVEQVAGRLVSEIRNAFGYSDIVMEYAETI